MKTIQLTEEQIAVIKFALSQEREFQRSNMPKEVRTEFDAKRRERAYEKIDAIETILEQIA